MNIKILKWKIKNFPNILRGAFALFAKQQQLAPVIIGKVYAKKINVSGGMTDYGLISTRVITNLFAAYVVDSFQDSGSFPLSDFRWHDSGIGTENESTADTELGEPAGLARVLGTQTEGAAANIYRSVATVTYDDTYAITEHGLFNAEELGLLLDRSKFAAINVENNDSIQFTYELTVSAGG